jgi:nitrate reductase gamma subunit
MSPGLHFLENELQIAALTFMATVYVFRLVWLFKFKDPRERTFAAGRARAAVTFSLLNVGRPWAMESLRKKPLFYIQFVIFHVGVAAAIAATFFIPYFPRFFEARTVVRLFQAVIGLAFCVGWIRLVRRLTTPALRLVSTVDDYLSLVLMILFFGFGFVAVARTPQQAEGPLVVYFALTAFFLVYVPFSKIGHYLYYPFGRYFLGRMMGHRGVYPFKTTAKASSTTNPPRGKS